jgi:hypothetical protein
MPTSADSKETITFYAHWLPALENGEYEVSVTPGLTLTFAADPDDPEAPATLIPATRIVRDVFHVNGPRFSLTGSEAYSCYPAPGQVGSFDGKLPHIVFDRCTLPWERTIDAGDRKNKPPEPWLALIVLTDADFITESDKAGQVPALRTTTIKDLMTPGSGIIGPQIELTQYEQDSDACQTIDLPPRVFARVMPARADLPFLAHVREVATDNKETWSLLKEGRFSVVLGNRFPSSQTAPSAGKDWGIVNTACLVSLEGWGAYLDHATRHADGAVAAFRLVVLGSWRFICQGTNDFKSLMSHIVKDSTALALPNLPESGDEIGRVVDEALRIGFAPVNHDFRNEDRLISWYRGPLVPIRYALSSSYDDLSCGDAALRFDPKTGMFDAEYASAWELGRLLALQDDAFAVALTRFRGLYQRWVRRANEAALSAADRRVVTSLGAEGDGMHDHYVAALQSMGWKDTRAARAESSTPPEIPSEIGNWLGQAMLLYGVPFQYLVPDGQMLPHESIRFFYLNPEWISCLLQGACRVGRSSETDEIVDQVLRSRFFDASQRIAAELRASAKAVAGRDGVADGAPHDTAAPRLNWPLSGYLLRSAAVEAWIGLESWAEGVMQPGGPPGTLQILRMDRLAPDLLLCIFNGSVKRLDVKQPPEAIHFGAARKAAPGGGYEKTSLRRLVGGQGAEEMGEVLKRINLSVPVREATGVIKLHELSQALKAQLDGNGQMPADAAITSAEFAVEMIDAPGRVSFVVKGA